MLGLGLSVFLVAAGLSPFPRLAPKTIAVAVRSLEGSASTVELEFRNLTESDLDLPVDVTLSLRELKPSDDEPIRLYTTLDPCTGGFGGYYANRSATRLRLQANQVRTIVVRLHSLKWSLGYDWVWTPLVLWQLANSGQYSLLVDFSISAPPELVERVFAGPVVVSVLSE